MIAAVKSENRIGIFYCFIVAIIFNVLVNDKAISDEEANRNILDFIDLVFTDSGSNKKVWKKTNGKCSAHNENHATRASLVIIRFLIRSE